MAWLEVVRTGPLATVQDRGRTGYGALGVGRSGAVDMVSHDSANRLVGNTFRAATIEVTTGGFAPVQAHDDGPRRPWRRAGRRILHRRRQQLDRL
ncbi:hypothetical protein ABT116_47590, partial [Streptomyces sp. NPDC002130]